MSLSEPAIPKQRRQGYFFSYRSSRWFRNWSDRPTSNPEPVPGRRHARLPGFCAASFLIPGWFRWHTRYVLGVFLSFPLRFRVGFGSLAGVFFSLLFGFGLGFRQLASFLLGLFVSFLLCFGFGFRQL